MSAGNPARPPVADGWVVAVHGSEDDFEPLGTAVVIGTDQVLTCAHVVMPEGPEGIVLDPLWVAFPNASSSARRRVASVEKVYARPVKDLAVLVLAEPVPAGVESAPLRCPQGKDLVDLPWWAFGFPDRDAVGNSADGLVGASLSYGWVRLDTSSRYLVQAGFSGGGLWSPDYGAVVGLVGQAHANGDGRAITLHQADLELPGLKLSALARWSAAAAGEGALAQWGWSLDRDPEGMRHWRPRARGVSIDSERGWRFRGRTAALTAIVSWLDRAVSDRRALVVTGSPGVGKSAVLGRIVTTADPGIAAALPPDDAAVRARVGSVACAVHAKGKTALEVAEEIAQAASAALPGEPGDLAPAIRTVLEQRDSSRFNVIIDALDEAASPDQARLIIAKIVLPLAETCADTGVQVMVGTRRRDDGGDLLGYFGGALTAIDLDDPDYFAEDDLAAYALASLQLTGNERRDNPYNDLSVAGPVAARIAGLSGRNFLIAGLIARSHGLHDDQPVAPGQLAFAATVDVALSAYLRLLPAVAGLTAGEVLTVLAFGEARGLPVSLWQAAIDVLYGRQISCSELIRFARSSAANFLLETTRGVTTGIRGESDGPAYRLFHQALNDTLLRERAGVASQAGDQRALTGAFLTHGRMSNWQNVPSYLLRALPGHAQAAEMVDDLLADDAFLLHADLRRVLAAASYAASADGHLRARLLRLTPQAITARSAERAALFSVTETLDNLGSSYRDGGWDAPYLARWATVRPRTERAVLEGHLGGVTAVCPVTVDGQSLLASGSRDGTVRLWDPATSEQRAVLEGHQSRVTAVCPVTVDGQPLLASGSDDGTVRLWDPATGTQRAVLEGHQDWVTAVCPVTVDGQPLLASGCGDGTVRLWDPATGTPRAVLEGQGELNVVCPVTVDGQPLLASGGSDRTVRLWDPATGVQRAVLEGHRGWVRAVCPVTVDGQSLLASGSDDRTVRLRDPATGTQRAVLEGHQGWVTAVCPVTVDGQPLLASGSDDGTVRLWDPATGTPRAVLEGQYDEVNAVCPVTVDGQPLLASGGRDNTVRLWDPATGTERAVLEGHQGEVNAVCPVTVDGQPLLASASSDRTMRLWDPATGEQRAVLKGHQGEVNAVCPVTVNGQPLLASGSDDGTVRLWDPATGTPRAVLEGHYYLVRAVCPVTVDGQPLLASGSSDDGTVRLWDPATGEQRAALKGHQGGVTAVCPVTVDGQPLLASASSDRTVRLWDPANEICVLTVPTHHAGLAVVCVSGLLAIGLNTGLLMISLSLSF